jgi:GTP1/Obg family GTP-binding protein
MAKELSQEQLIANWEKAKAKADSAEDAMRQHFNRLVAPKIKSAKTLEDLRLVKESLRDMPDCVGKVLLFRAIIITEDDIKRK